MNKILKKVRGIKNVPKLILLYISFSFIFFIIDFLFNGGRIKGINITFIEPFTIRIEPDYVVFSIIILFLYGIFYDSLYKKEYLEINKQDKEQEKRKKEEKREKLLREKTEIEERKKEKDYIKPENKWNT